MKFHTFGNKKGSLMDPILSGAYIIKIVVTIFIAIAVWIGFQSVMTQTISGGNDPSGGLLSSIMTDLQSAYFSIDYMFPFLIGGLMLISIIFAFKTGSNIIWGIFSLIVWAIALLMATVFQNVYIMVSNQFPTIYASMPVMDIIMMNMRWVVLFWIAAITAVMFRKSNAEDDTSEMSRRFYGR